LQGKEKCDSSLPRLGGGLLLLAETAIFPE